MNRRQFLATSGGAAIPAFAGSIGGAEERTVFPYRGWSFCVHANNWDLLDDFVTDALERAADYGINTFELHDYNIGRRGLVDAAAQYRAFPKLAAHETLHYGGEIVSRSQKDADYERLRSVAKRIKGRGLKLNCWYHVMRDAPRELFEDYPEIKDGDSGFYFEYLEGLVREFFERVPEADRLTITSLHETPSVLSRPGRMTRDERLLKLYQAIYGACKSAGKELIIRDFIVQRDDFESFWNILGKIPPDVYIMTKEVMADWIHLDMPLNPFLSMYRGRKVIVEFDLYGEYWGKLEIPACYPEYIHRQLRNIRAFDVQGAMGRVVHDNQRSSVFRTIFDSPNEVNCYAFGKILSRPMPWLGKGVFTDPREPPGRWGWDLDAFDKKIWVEWVSRRYGRKAAVPMIRALSRTSQILPLIIDIGGRGFQQHSHVPGVRFASFLWEPFVDQVRALGMDFLRDEKRQALVLNAQTMEDILEARPGLSETDFTKLKLVFEGERLIIRGYQAVLESYYQIYLAQSSGDGSGLKAAGENLRHLAGEVARARGEKFFGAMPATLREMGDFVEAGKPPAKQIGS